MTQKTINIGAADDDGTGDPLRTAFSKTNDNFDELYGRKGFFPTLAALLAAGTDLVQDQVLIVLGDGANDGVYVATKDTPTAVGDFTYSPFSRNTQIQFMGPLTLPSGDPNNGPNGVANGDHLVTDKAIWMWDTVQGRWLKKYDLDAGTPILATQYMGPADLPTGNPNDKAGLVGEYLLTDRSVWKYNTVTSQWDRKYDIARTPPTIYMGPSVLKTGNPNDIAGLTGYDKQYLVTEREAWYYDVATAQWIKDFNLVAPPRIPTIYKSPVELPTGDPNDKTGLVGSADGDHLVTDKSVWTWKDATRNWVKEFDFDRPEMPMKLAQDDSARDQLAGLLVNDLVFVSDTGKMYQFIGTPGVGTKTATDWKEVTGGIKTVPDTVARDALTNLVDGDLVFVKDQTKIYEYTTTGSGGWLVVSGEDVHWPNFSTDDPTTTALTGDKQDDWMIVKNSVWSWDAGGKAWNKVFDLEDPRADAMPMFMSPALLTGGTPNGVVTGGANNQFLVAEEGIWQWNGTTWNKYFDFTKTPPTLFRNPPNGDPNSIAGLSADKDTCLLTESAAWHYNGSAWVKDFDLTVEHDYKIAANLPAMDALPTPTEGTLVQVMNTVDTAPGNNLPGFYTYVNGLWQSLYPSPPDLTTYRSLRYDPDVNSFVWEDVSEEFEVVFDTAALTQIPASHLAPGKLVYVRAENLLYVHIPDNSTRTNTMDDWKPFITGITYVGRVGNLPQSAVDGQAFIILMDMAGKKLERLVTWRDQGNIDVATVLSGTLPIQDGASETLTVSFPSGTPTATSNDEFVIELMFSDGTVVTRKITVAIGDTEDAVAAKVHVALGQGVPQSTVTVANNVLTITPTGYDLDSFFTTASSLAGSRGGWVFLNRENWVKALRADPDQTSDRQEGDLQITTEANGKELKVYESGAWQTVYSEDDVKAWIAAGSQFQGTVEETSHGVAGAIDLDALPAESSLSAGEKAHYWIWVGSPSYTVSASTIGGAASAIDGTALSVGDWIIVAETGIGTGTFAYRVIPGDLMSRTVARQMFSMQPWVQGAMPQDSVVVYNGDVYRAGQAIGANDPTPDDPASTWTRVDISGGLKVANDDNQLPNTAPAGQVWIVLSSANAGGKQALYGYDSGGLQWVELGGGGGGIPLDFHNSAELLNIGTPVGSVIAYAGNGIPAGWLLCDGQRFSNADYPELEAALGQPKTPDLRNQFIMGGTAATPFVHHQDTTRMPRAPFHMDRQGNHHHAGVYVGNYGNGWPDNPGDSIGVGHGESYVRNTRRMPYDGSHLHTISGGDSVTRPNHVILKYIIKASDRTLRTR